MTFKKKRIVYHCPCGLCQQYPRGAVAREHLAINRVLVGLDEKNRRRFVGLLALQWGRGGVTRLSEITGLSRTTIRRGRSEVQRHGRPSEDDRVRVVGAGRPAIEKNTRKS